MDDTFTKLQQYELDSFTDHLNLWDAHVKFTIEPETNRKLYFLDTCVQIKGGGAAKVTI